MLNRRKFVVSSVSVAAIAGSTTGPLAVAQQFITDCSHQPHLQQITKATFEALQGELFQLRDEFGQITDVQLVEVRDEGSDERLEQFSVQFRSVHNTDRLTEATYTVEHCTAGQCQLYLQASDDSAQSTVLRATFALLS